jgi:spore maturation protein CgeB
MCINFPESAKPGFDQIKGRVFETLASNSLLLERKNSITPRYLKPGVHYVEYEDQFDLLDKINYYSLHTEERDSIARNGKELYESAYNPKIFWDTITNRLGFGERK